MMKMRKLFAVVLLMIVTLSARVSVAQEMPPIPVDDKVRIGKLENGLTYYIRHNDYPEHLVNFYIAQRVGAMQEEDDQNGLAHFLEHMAFNGSKHFNGEGKGILDYTRSLGVSFGGDLNAYTSYTETVYNIDNVPSTRQSALDSCLLILRDWSHGLLLTDEEIDKERGVIHEEWRMGQGPDERMRNRQMETLFPGSKYAKRNVIGLMEIVDNFPYQVLRDYYDKWYRPDNQAIIIVGDVDTDHIEAKIKELFNDLPVPGPDAAQVVGFPVPDNEEPIVAIDKDKEQQYSEVMVMFKHDAVEDEDKATIDYQILEYAKEVIYNMFAARFAEKSQEPDCPFIQAYAFDDDYMGANTKDAFTMFCIPKEGKTEEATQAMVTEAMRALKHGFTASEYARAQEEYLSWLEKQFNNRDKISNAAYGRSFSRHFLENEPIASIEQIYSYMPQIVPMITVEHINQILPELISDNDKNLVVVNFNQEKDGAVYPTAQSMLAAINNARTADIAPYVDNVRQEPLISQLPKAGKIVSERENTTFGYKELELSNGARVILKKTDFKENEIRLNAFQRGGASLYDEKDWANTELMPAIVMMSGLGNFSNTELKKATAGKQASVMMSMDTYEDEITGNSTVKDLETLFQLLYLNFTAINKDEKSYNQLMSQLETVLKNRDLDPENVFEDSVSYIFANHNWRNKPFTADALKNVDYDRALAIAKERTANAANYTFTFVGAFDEAVIRPYIEQYIASLPGQKGKQSSFVDVASHPQGQTISHFTRKSETPKAVAQIYWFDDKTPYTLENQIKANILGQVLSKIFLQKIREDESAAYSAGARGYSTYEGNKFLTAVMGYCPMKPEKADVALRIMNEEMVEACKSIDPTTLKEIKELFVKDLTTDFKENGYWVRTLHNYLFTGADSHTGILDIVNAQTPESIAAFAKQLLSAGNKVEVVMMPEE